MLLQPLGVYLEQLSEQELRWLTARCASRLRLSSESRLHVGVQGMGHVRGLHGGLEALLATISEVPA